MWGTHRNTEGAERKKERLHWQFAFFHHYIEQLVKKADIYSGFLVLVHVSWTISTAWQMGDKLINSWLTLRVLMPCITNPKHQHLIICRFNQLSFSRLAYVIFDTNPGTFRAFIFLITTQDNVGLWPCVCFITAKCGTTKAWTPLVAQKRFWGV